MLKKTLLLSLLTGCFMVYWHVSMGTRVCFGDCFQYIVLMGKSFFSLAYWETFIRMYRPFTVPVIYSFFGDFTSQHQQWIVYFQTGFAFFAWVVFAFSFSSLVKTQSFKMAIFTIILLAMFGRSSYIYNMQLLSDSIALSLLLLWYSSIIHLQKIISWAHSSSKKYFTILCLFAAFTFIVVSTRDTHAFMIIFAVPLILKMRLTAFEKILLTTIILYIGIACQLNADHRNRTNMLNIITGVVLPDLEKREFFIKKGMPVDEQLFANPEVVKNWDFVTLRFDPIHSANEQVEKVMTPFLSKAKIVYAEYLVSHPGYVLTNLQKYRRYIFNQSYTEQTGHVMLGRLSLMDDLPLDWLVALALLGLVSHFALPSFAQRENVFLFYSSTFMLAGFANATIAFHGDFWAFTEMQRHPFIGSIFFKIGSLGILISVAIEMYVLLNEFLKNVKLSNKII